MNYKVQKEKWQCIQWFFDRLWENPDQFPDQGVLLSLSEKEEREIFDINRLSLLRMLLKTNKALRTDEIAVKVHRHINSVSKDLDFLKSFLLVEKDEQGPWKGNEVIILPEIKFRTKHLGKEFAVNSEK